MERDKFLKLVEQEIAMDSNVLAVLLKIVTDKWDAMVQAQKDNREASSRYAVDAMLNNLWIMRVNRKKSPKLFNNMECCNLLDALDAVDPKCVGGSAGRVELLRHISNSFHALGWKPEDPFIKRIRNKSELVENLYKNFPPAQFTKQPKGE